METILIYAAAVSLAAIVLTVYDKAVAGGKARRVPEKTLLLTALLGGSVAMYATMRLIRHKTQHKKFMLGLPLIMLLQAALIFGYIYLL
ncbi:MAG: DUF1294 domain-containing protein [Bacillota bacterium]|nr:DUF1294 domain-containing protein [Bacillota bacterium]